MTPVFLIASERSGTNLLRAILSAHTRIKSPPPSGIVHTLHPNLEAYFPLNAPCPCPELLAQDAITLTKTHLNPWDIELDPAKLLKRAQPLSLWSLFGALHDCYAEAHGVQVWLSKEPGLHHHIYELALHFPEAKFIYLVRDGRDVAASMLKGGIHAKTIQEAATKWAGEQQQSFATLTDPLLRERTCFLTYEALLKDPRDMVSRMMTFLGLEVENKQFEYYRNEETIAHAKSSVFWQKVASPINSDNSGKYRQQLSARDIEIFESIAGDILGILGYERDYEDPRPMKLRDRLKERLVRKHSQSKSKTFITEEEVERRRRRAEIVERIIRQRKEQCRKQWLADAPVPGQQ